jgi:hypothetical protein
MSFIDQLMAARGLPISLFGGNNRYTTPPINPSPNVNTIPDGGYNAGNLLPTGGVSPQVNMGLMGRVRQPAPQPWETWDINKPGDILPQSYLEAVKQTISEIGKKEPPKEPPIGISHIRNYFTSKGYSKEAIAGILGNIDVETGGSYDPEQKQRGGSGRGIFQMDGKMLAEFKKHLKYNNLKSTIKTQIDFLHAALTDEKTKRKLGTQSTTTKKSKRIYDVGWRVRKRVREAIASGNVDRITRVFSDEFLQPNPKKNWMNRRLESAQKHYVSKRKN